MELNDLISKTGQWLKGTGDHGDIVMSSRIRLARNLSKKPFPNKARKKDLQDILAIVQAAVKDILFFKKTILLKMTELDNVDKQFLIERHLMSHEHANNPEGKALVVSEEEVLSLMINEEDHLRLQVMESGLNLNETWKIASAIDDALSGKLDFAYSISWGYLTACPRIPARRCEDPS